MRPLLEHWRPVPKFDPKLMRRERFRRKLKQFARINKNIRVRRIRGMGLQRVHERVRDGFAASSCEFARVRVSSRRIRGWIHNG